MIPKVFLLFFCLCAFSYACFSQSIPYKLEITQDDVVSHPDVNASQISVFSVGLGMSRETADSILKTKPLYYYIDHLHSTDDFRIYVYDLDAKGNKKNCILYLIWENGSFTLTRIVIYYDFLSYLKGESIRLLGFEAINPTSDVLKMYLGVPASSEVTLDIPSIGLKYITYYYPQRGIQVTDKYSSDGRTIAFSLYTVK